MPSTSKHLKRKLENEFKDTLQMIQMDSSIMLLFIQMALQETSLPWFAFN